MIGDPIRLQILTMLKHEEVYVQELTEKLGLSFTTLSHHMTKLVMAGLITSERRGIYVYYKANIDFLRWLKTGWSRCSWSNVLIYNRLSPEQ